MRIAQLGSVGNTFSLPGILWWDLGWLGGDWSRGTGIYLQHLGCLIDRGTLRSYGWNACFFSPYFLHVDLATANGCLTS